MERTIMIGRPQIAVDDAVAPCDARIRAARSGAASSRKPPTMRVITAIMLMGTAPSAPTPPRAPRTSQQVPPRIAYGRTTAQPVYIPYDVVGAWGVMVEVREGVSCVIVGRFASGAVLRVGIDRDGPVPLVQAVVSNPAWRGVSPDTDYRVGVAFGAAASRIVTARSGSVGAPPSLTIAIDDLETARSFATTSRMVLTRGGREMARLGLSSTLGALAAMASCQAEIDALGTAMEDGSENDAEDPSPSPAERVT